MRRWHWWALGASVAGGAAAFWWWKWRGSSWEPADVEEPALEAETATSIVVPFVSVKGAGPLFDPVPSGYEAAFAAALPKAGRQFAPIFVQVGRESGVSPWVLAAIAEQESGFNPDIISSDGFDRGLMQINTIHHLPNWQDPVANVRKAAEILKERISYFAAVPRTPTVTVTMTLALRMGVSPGVFRDPRPLYDVGVYTSSVLAAYNGSLTNVLKAVATGADPDSVTTGKSYSASILRRMNNAKSRFAPVGA